MVESAETCADLRKLLESTVYAATLEGSMTNLADGHAAWRPTAYAGYYVNEHGEVRGPRGRVLRPGIRGRGYQSVTVTGGKNALVHQLVCIAFHGPRPTPTHQAAHNNGNPGDNRAVNLRWATPAENTEDSRRHGTFPLLPGGKIGELNQNARLTREEALAIRSEYATGLVSLRALAERFGVHKSHVHRIVTGKRWAYGLSDHQEGEE